MNTFEFEITIQGKSGDNSWPIVVRCKQPDGLTIHSKGMLQLSQDDFYQLTAALEDEKEYGTLLGKALFQENVRDIFVRALSKSSEDCFLRILLSVEAAEKDEVRTLHWERLCAPIDADGAWHLLARDRRVPFSLYIPTIIDRRFPPIGRRDLRALVLVASPDNLGAYQLSPFDVEAAISGVGQALGKIPYDILANNVKGALGPPTLEELSKQLTNAQKPYTLLHFVCHGMLSNDAQRETALFWATADNQVQRVTGKQLLEELRYVGGQKGLPHFAFLCSCESADPRAEGALGGLAQRLVRDLGMPAVVAMTRKVSVNTALALGKSFYQRLGNSGVVDVALQEATAGLGNRSDITVPALFSRLGGRPLFSDRLENRELTDAEIEYGIGKLQDLLKERARNASKLNERFETQAKTLKNTLGAESRAARDERKQALVELNNICDQILDFSFDELAASDKKPPEYKAECPFPGLSSFGDKKYHKFFFGRDELSQELQNKLHKDNFLAVIGPSGSGKSSVVLAGLIPKLKEQQPSLQWVYLTPGREPSKQLEKRLERLSKVPHQHSLLVVDQFEELFTLCDDEVNRQEFIKKLLTIAQQQKVIITMRADFLGECTFYEELRKSIETRQKLVGPMTPAELVTVMKMQADGAGLRFETGLSNSILNDVQEEPGAMPLLQYALQELWKRRHGRWLCDEEYGAIGRVQQAIAKTANDFYNNLPNSQQKNQVRDIFLRLTRLDESTVQGEKRRDTRRRVTLEDLVPIDGELAVTKKLVQQLAGEGARLVVTSRNETTGKEEVEVAHEALIRYWPMLQEWLDENRTNLLLREKIRQESLEWNQHKRDEDYLELKGAQLVVSEALLQQPMFLNKLEAEYVKACVELRDRRLKEKEEAARNLLLQKNQALRSQSLFLADLARQKNEEGSFATAILLALEALPNESNPEKPYVAEAEAQLYQAIINLPKQKKLLGHQGSINYVVFSPDGKRMVTASDDGTARLWDAQTGQKLHVLTGHNDVVTHAAFSPNNRFIVTTSQDGTACLWNAKTGQNLHVLTGHNDVVTHAAFSPDSQLVVTVSGRYYDSQDHTARLWDVNSGHQINILEIPDNLVRKAAFSPDGQLIVIASYGGGRGGFAHLWEISSDRVITTIEGHASHPVLNATFSADGQRLLTVDGTWSASLWEVNSGELIIQLKGHESYVESAVFSLDEQQVLTASSDGTARLWEVNTGRQIFTITGHESKVNCATFSPDGELIVTASDDGTARLWEANSGKPIVVLEGHKSEVNYAAFSLDGERIATVSNDKTLRLWEVNSSKLVTVLEGHNDRVQNAAFSPDSQQVLTASNDGNACLWNVNNGELIAVLEHESGVNHAAFSPDGQYMVTASSDSTTCLWDDTGELMFVLKGDEDMMTYAAFSPDGQHVVTVGGGRRSLFDGDSNKPTAARLWDVNTGKFIAVLEQHESQVWHAAFSPNGQSLVTVSWDKSARMWDINSAQTIAVLQGHTDRVIHTAFNSNGQSLVTASYDGTARVWDVNTSNLVTVLEGHKGAVMHAAFSPDGKRILTASLDGTARVWDVNSVNSATVLEGHKGGVMQATFSPDSKRILTASYDGTARLWNTDTGKCFVVLKGHGSNLNYVTFSAPSRSVNHAVFSPDGKFALTASDDGTARLWSLFSDTEALINYARNVVPFKQLSAEQRKQFFLSE
ncbi:WD-40 repeat-containing protein [Kalymmatonema gypsitolerans NIES-4073]|nr:WD-40 repeat-containing protein [Scytonema sp. NIES-4073]